MTAAPALSKDAAALKAELEALAESWLRPYLQRLERRRLQPEHKVINDAIWGSIRLEPWEVGILDSPLLQRLRGLRQLGVIHWVYPNAGHSRLEHSIGVVHQVQALIDGLERNSGSADQRLVDDKTVKLMRLGALVHDTGHTVMSHVSEHFIKTIPGVEELRMWCHATFHPRKPPSPSEAFAAIFVQSDSFQRLLGSTQLGADFIRDPVEASYQIAGLLLGAPVFPGKAFLSLAINGAFDADKLDYMCRDAVMAGVPSTVDVARVIEKVHCVSVPPGQRTDLLQTYRTWSRLKDTEPALVLALRMVRLTSFAR